MGDKDRVKCAQCKGRGTVTFFPYFIVCPKCEGTGSEEECYTEGSESKMKKYTEVYACVECGEDTWGGGVSLPGDNAGTRTMCHQCAEKKSEVPTSETEIE